METTYQSTQEDSVTTNAPEISTEGTISKKALVTFISGAVIVFSLAIWYCLTTNHEVEGGVLTGALGIVLVFAATAYKSFK